MRFLAAFVLLGTLGSGAAAAADCQDPANLLAQHNCGFDKDAKGWTAVPGAAVSHDVADRGVLEAAADSQGSLTIEGPCVAAQGKTGYHIGARPRVAAGTVTGAARSVQVRPVCSGQPGFAVQFDDFVFGK